MYFLMTSEIVHTLKNWFMPKLNYCVMKITWANVSIEKALAGKITQRVIDSKWTARWHTYWVNGWRRGGWQYQGDGWGHEEKAITIRTVSVDANDNDNNREVEYKLQGGGGQEGGAQEGKVQEGGGWVWISQRSQGWSQWYGLAGPVDLSLFRIWFYVMLLGLDKALWCLDKIFTGRFFSCSPQVFTL